MFPPHFKIKIWLESCLTSCWLFPKNSLLHPKFPFVWFTNTCIEPPFFHITWPFFKNHTHVKKVGHTSEIFLAFYWWTWKTNNYQKKCWSGPIKNKKCCIFFKKMKKNTCRYHYQNLDDMIYVIYSSWDIEQNTLKLVILGHLLPFNPHKNPKIKILKNEKICWRYHHFTHVYQKSQSYEVSETSETCSYFFILGHFLPYSPNHPYGPRKSKFWNNEQHTWR